MLYRALRVILPNHGWISADELLLPRSYISCADMQAPPHAHARAHAHEARRVERGG